MSFNIRTEIYEHGKAPEGASELQAVLDQCMEAATKYIGGVIEKGCTNGDVLACIAGVSASLAATLILREMHPDDHAHSLATVRKLINAGLEQAGM